MTVQLRTLSGEVIVIDVIDNGPGVPKELKEAMIEPFARGDAARSLQRPTPRIWPGIGHREIGGRGTRWQISASGRPTERSNCTAGITHPDRLEASIVRGKATSSDRPAFETVNAEPVRRLLLLSYRPSVTSPATLKLASLETSRIIADLFLISSLVEHYEPALLTFSQNSRRAAPQRRLVFPELLRHSTLPSRAVVIAQQDRCLMGWYDWTFCGPSASSGDRAQLLRRATSSVPDPMSA